MRFRLMSVLGALLVGAILLLSGSPDRPVPSLADADRSPFIDGPEPADWVARVGDRYLTRGVLARVVVARTQVDLARSGSGVSTVLRQLVAEHVVAREAERLGIQVTHDEVQDRYRTLHTRVAGANPARNLVAVIEDAHGITVEEFLPHLRHEMLKEKIAGHPEHQGHLADEERARSAQIEVVFGRLLEKAWAEGVSMPVVGQDLANGAIARVDGSLITQEEFGAQLVLRLPRSRITEVIQEECRAELAREWMLTIDEMKAAIAVEEERWLQRRELATQEALRKLSYEDWVRMAYKFDLEGLKCSRYFRCLYGMVEANRQQVTDEEVERDYGEKRNTMYGERFLVTNIQIAFAPSEDQQGPSGGRTCEEAHARARGMLRRLSSGLTLDELVREREAARDGTLFSRRLRVRRAGSSMLLYEHAKQMRDGELSRAIEGPDAVHIIRREGWIAAPAFKDVEDLIGHRLAFDRAHDWFEERMSDPELVEIRWPGTGDR